ncbi:LysR family transcriptional regulator [Pseudomonas sp. CCM 7893]|uniref:LysR family transcriptional regulator n=1 Tax=Pseudomonas spelaei TaxID=1055469 RepID=A0A6I3WGX7_9PSED|nr:LysR family transcriptional regulator [Pseudomonas spelaei]
MFDLNDVAVFVQIVDAGSFAGAARRTGTPPNTLSRRVKQLEEIMGVRLLHRSTRKLVLTDAGEALYERSANQVMDLMEVSRQLVQGNQEPTGRVRVAAPADFFEIFQMDFVAGFLAQYPKVRLDFVLNDQRADLIAEGIDLAFRSGALSDSSLVARKISTGRRILAASRTYLDAYGTPENVYALGEHACIRTSPSSAQTHWHLVGPQGSLQIDVSGQFCASTAQSQLKASIAGLGICLLPEPILRSSLVSGHLVQVLPSYSQQNNDLSILYPSRKQIPLAVSTFVVQAIAHLQEQNT